MGRPKTKKALSFNVLTAEHEALKKYAEARGMTITEAIRKAIKTEFFVADQDDKGNKILFEEPDGSQFRLVRS